MGTCLIVKIIGLYFCNLHHSNSGYVFTLILYYLGFIIGKIKYWIELNLYTTFKIIMPDNLKICIFPYLLKACFTKWPDIYNSIGQAYTCAPILNHCLFWIIPESILLILQFRTDSETILNPCWFWITPMPILLMFQFRTDSEHIFNYRWFWITFKLTLLILQFRTAS